MAKQPPRVIVPAWIERAWKDVALAALASRRAHAPTRIDNASLPAGSPMYFYCEACGALADTKDELWFISPPRRWCSDCQDLKDVGWLE